MLDSLFIKNYRNLKELKIDSLGRINLITGKNNTGKSTVLEAIAIYAAKGDSPLIDQLLGDRGESFKVGGPNKDVLDSNIRALSSLFTNRYIGFEIVDAISIGSIVNTLFGDDQQSEKLVSLRFVKFFDEIVKDNQGVISNRKRILLHGGEDKNYANNKIGFEIREGSSSYIIPLDDDRPYRYGYKGIGHNERCQLIRTSNIDREINGKLFDNIALTEKEQYVIDALKIIEPSTERIAFVEENPRQRTAVIKLSGNQGVLPLRSMGDGLNRILSIILALVNSDDGFLLIDEFENGLHYTVQEQLWEIVFNLSQKLNIQVFVTTHSEDCISGFEHILNRQKYSIDGKLIRLDSRAGTIVQVEYSADELKIANDLNIETR